jgi:hypothetical protein
MSIGAKWCQIESWFNKQFQRTFGAREKWVRLKIGFLLISLAGWGEGFATPLPIAQP